MCCPQMVFFLDSMSGTPYWLQFGTSAKDQQIYGGASAIFFSNHSKHQAPPKKNSIVFYAVFWFEGFVGWLRYGANAMAWNGPLPWVQPSKPVSKPSSSPATQLKDVDQWVGRRPREGSKGGALGIPFDSSKVWETPWKILCISST